MIQRVQHWVHDTPRRMEIHKPVERAFLKKTPQGPFSSLDSKQPILEPVARYTMYGTLSEASQGISTQQIRLPAIRRYTVKRNETAPRNHTRHDRTEKRGKNSSLHDNNSTLHDTCPTPQLTKARTEVYIITKSSGGTTLTSKQFAPFPIFPPFSRKLMLTKCRNNHHYLSGCKTLGQPFCFKTGFPTAFPPPFRSLHSYIGNAFHKHAP
jgi:hypothetical protein